MPLLLALALGLMPDRGDAAQFVCPADADVDDAMARTAAGTPRPPDMLVRRPLAVTGGAAVDAAAAELSESVCVQEGNTRNVLVFSLKNTGIAACVALAEWLISTPFVEIRGHLCSSVLHAGLLQRLHYLPSLSS